MSATIEQQPAAQQRRPWYRWWYTYAAVGIILLAGLGLGLFFALGSSGTSAASILEHDGYSVTQTLSTSQVQAALASDKSQDAQMARAFISGDAAVGAKGNSEEVALKLSSSGKQLITTLMPLIQESTTNGVSARVDGDYIVVSGPKSEIGSGNNIFNLGS
jgi:hypothetical protein